MDKTLFQHNSRGIEINGGMKKMLGIECRWECGSCGNILKTQGPFWNKKFMKLIEEPSRCGCGRKSGFVLLGFKECQFEVVKETE